MCAFLKAGVWVLLLTLAAGPAVALSIFDIIQLSKNGYADEQIIALIESTDSPIRAASRGSFPD